MYFKHALENMFCLSTKKVLRNKSSNLSMQTRVKSLKPKEEERETSCFVLLFLGAAYFTIRGYNSATGTYLKLYKMLQEETFLFHFLSITVPQISLV